MTFSIAAYCPESGQFGIALSSSSIAVGARCPWLQAGVGAVSSQNITLPALGQLALAQLEQGFAPDIALRRALAEDDFSRYRQIIAIDANGQTAAFSGDKTLVFIMLPKEKTALPLEICWPARRLLRQW
jgi:uncharacterized Ntn-hydrolase superfamily protein